MCKKLLSFVLVLALAGISSAATYYWTGPQVGATPGEWQDSGNWGGITPALGADIWRFTSSSGAGAAGVVTTGTAYSGKIQFRSATGINLRIESGATLQYDGSLEAYTSTSTIDILGTMNEYADALNTGTLKLGGNGLSNVINIWGTLNVKSNNSTFTSALALGHTGGLGGGEIHVQSGGTMYADSIVFTGTTNYIYLSGTGQVQVKGDVTGTYPLSTKFYGNGGLGGVVATYDSDTNLTTIVVPEPATIAMLGIGSLMLLRRKR